MASENDKEEEERKMISRCFHLSSSRGHRRGFSKRQDDVEGSYCHVAFVL